MKRILPIAESPVIGYLHHAYILSIVLNNPGALPYFYSNYIQLYCKKDIASHFKVDYFNFYNEPFVFFWDCIETEEMTKEEMTIPIDRFVINCIDNQQYFYTYINHTVLPYKNKEFVEGKAHDILIYGYEWTERSFHVLDFDSESRYSNFVITFDDLIKGYETA